MTSLTSKKKLRTLVNARRGPLVPGTCTAMWGMQGAFSQVNLSAAPAAKHGLMSTWGELAPPNVEARPDLAPPGPRAGEELKASKHFTLGRIELKS